jgi:hypothetical protein
MNVLRLIVREIRYRKLNFALGVLSVLVAVGVLVAELTLLHTHDLRTEAIIAKKEAETEAKMAEMQDDYRKMMKKLGFNILILPKDQQLGDLFAEDYAAKTMPEDYAKRLADSRIMTVRHLLPILQRKLLWPEQKRTILLVGTRGEVPLAHRKPKKPIMTLVPRDQMVVGYELHRSLGLEEGGTTKLLGHEFTVAKCHPERGTKDDITIWINLEQAQELLHEKGLIESEDRINGILALQCFCANSMLDEIRKDVAAILPDTQVIEFQTKVLIRAEARQRAAEEAKRAIAAEKAHRARMREEREGFAAIIVPVVIIGCTVWVGFLAYTNVRERRPEIGILRALGVRRVQVFGIFLGKALLVGLAGAALGYLGGLLVGVQWGEAPAEVAGAAPLFDPSLLLTVLLAAPLLSAVASWLPALTAAQQDPAVVLTNA